MRCRAALLVVAGLVFAGLGCSQAPKGLVGAWEMVGSELAADSTAAGVPDPLVSVKVLSDGHFAFGRMTVLGEVWAGGGLYSYDGRGHYSEFITYNSIPALVGKKIDFTCRLRGDLWYHDASSTVDGERIEIHEVWRRIHRWPGALPDVPQTPGRGGTTADHASALGAAP